MSYYMTIIDKNRVRNAVVRVKLAKVYILIKIRKKIHSAHVLTLKWVG